MSGMTHDRDLLIKLRGILDSRFAEGELRTLCFDLGVDYDNLPGTTKADKARELVLYQEHHQQIDELIGTICQSRPDISIGDHKQQERSSSYLLGPDVTEQSPIDNMPSILFVDDEIEIMDSLLSLFEDKGFQVKVATDLQQAKDALASDEAFSLIITDLMLPSGEREAKVDLVRMYAGLDVIETARKLRGNIPIIILSAVGSPGVREDLARRGVIEILSKPIPPDEVVERTRQVYRLYRLSSRNEMTQQEIKRRKRQLSSYSADTRKKAIWALGEVGHDDPSVIEFLNKVKIDDIDETVRQAACEALDKLTRKLGSKENLDKL
jgi:CheY-like chemotaxis protein